ARGDLAAVERHDLLDPLFDAAERDALLDEAHSRPAMLYFCIFDFSVLRARPRRRAASRMRPPDDSSARSMSWRSTLESTSSYASPVISIFAIAGLSSEFGDGAGPTSTTVATPSVTRP